MLGLARIAFILHLGSLCRTPVLAVYTPASPDLSWGSSDIHVAAQLFDAIETPPHSPRPAPSADKITSEGVNTSPQRSGGYMPLMASYPYKVSPDIISSDRNSWFDDDPTEVFKHLDALSQTPRTTSDGSQHSGQQHGARVIQTKSAESAQSRHRRKVDKKGSTHHSAQANGATLRDKGKIATEIDAFFVAANGKTGKKLGTAKKRSATSPAGGQTSEKEVHYALDQNRLARKESKAREKMWAEKKEFLHIFDAPRNDIERARENYDRQKKLTHVLAKHAPGRDAQKEGT